MAGSGPSVEIGRLERLLPDFLGVSGGDGDRLDRPGWLWRAAGDPDLLGPPFGGC